MSRPIIEVENVSKRYKLGQVNVATLREEVQEFFQRFRKKGNGTGMPDPRGNGSEFWALKDVSFSVHPGEVVGIIGRNGAGKSTLLKILSRVTEPTSGEIRIRGRVASLLEVGTGFHPDLTGRENIYLNGTILGMTKAEVRAKFDEIVAFAETERFLDTPVKRYSSGMYVRLAFAVAAHLEPEILIVDEVLAVGDVQFQKKCMGKMDDVARHGRTVLFVSHNMVAVRSLCSRAVLLEDGRMIIDGESNKVVDQYIDNGAEAQGIIEWNDLAKAPGDHCVRLKSIYVNCNDMGAGKVDIQKDFKVSVEYWVLQENSRIIVSFHLHNARGELVVTSGNMNSVSAIRDPWVERPYPSGLYRTSCVYPGRLFNDGTYTVSVYINDSSVDRSHVVEHEALRFQIVDSGFMREEYQGPWLGNLRMKLPWSTEAVTGSSRADLHRLRGTSL
jgi:lipopolysaccharide transport system ATP-binding protein